jgi:hypothetical protein
MVVPDRHKPATPKFLLATGGRPGMIAGSRRTAFSSIT